MKCPKCGYDNQEGAKFCNQCSNTLNQQPSESDIKTAERKKKNNKFALLLGCGGVIAIAIIIGIFIAVSSGGSSTTTTTPTLNAGISFTGTQFVIQNNDSFDWTNVQMELNSPGLFSNGYILNTSLIQAHNTYTVGAAQFVKSDGTRFDPFTTKPMEMDITCDGGSFAGTWK